VTRSDAYRLEAEAAERRAARCYNVVEYGELLELARGLRARAAAAETLEPAPGTESPPTDV
jgi:hypothetical protein